MEHPGRPRGGDMMMDDVCPEDCMEDCLMCPIADPRDLQEIYEPLLPEEK